ncbi:hypothetical protein O6H91_09G106800 [Diphasiastrum complanatum]|uniref:Uncharacterized protein n=1 Tax=Diphasiastrum complanatum TaxID=34168 RepID=A0ACC2CSS5_DIPCM|nr:hypothetical protein O6H91_09G106800 [Diphasiastrum complanatum]
MMMVELPVIDLEPYLLATGRDVTSSSSARHNATVLDLDIQQHKDISEVCERVASCLREAGALVVRDPRCSFQDNDRFLDMMERYFGQTAEFKRQQERPHLHYQVGVTPEGVELPRCIVDKSLQEQIQELPEKSRPHMPLGPDAKWRYMWRVGPRPKKTSFKELNAEPVVPDGFPDWIEVMNGWGTKMIAAVEVVAEMAAIGFGIPQFAFTSLMSQVVIFQSIQRREASLRATIMT